MGDIFKEFVDKAPEIIGKAAQSPLGLACLIVLVLGAVGAYLFRNAAGNQQLLAFALMTGGFLGFMAFALVSPPPEPPPNINGAWHDANDPSILGQVTQRDHQFEFTRSGTLPGGIQFESSGNGTLLGSTFRSTYNTKYKDGSTSTGSCWGAFPRDGVETWTCKDTMYGEFNGSMIRE